MASEHYLLDELSDEQFNFKLQLHKLSSQFDSDSVSVDNLASASEFLKDAKSTLRDRGYRLHALSQQGFINSQGDINFRDLDSIKHDNEVVMYKSSIKELNQVAEQYSSGQVVTSTQSTVPASVQSSVRSLQNENFPLGHNPVMVDTSDIEMADEPVVSHKRTSRDMSPIRATQPLIPFGSPGTPKIRARLRSDMNKELNNSSNSRQLSESPPLRSRQRPRSGVMREGTENTNINLGENSTTKNNDIHLDPPSFSLQSISFPQEHSNGNKNNNNNKTNDINEKKNNNSKRSSTFDIASDEQFNRLEPAALINEIPRDVVQLQPDSKSQKGFTNGKTDNEKFHMDTHYSMNSNGSTSFFDVFTTQSSDLAKGLVSENKELREKLASLEVNQTIKDITISNIKGATKEDAYALLDQMDNLTLEEVHEEIKTRIGNNDKNLDNAPAVESLQTQLQAEQASNDMLRAKIQSLETEIMNIISRNPDHSPLTMEQELYFRQYDNQRLRNIRNKLQFICSFQKFQLKKYEDARMQRLYWLSEFQNSSSHQNQLSNHHVSLHSISLAVIFLIRVRKAAVKSKQSRKRIKELVGLERFIRPRSPSESEFEL